VTRVVIVTGGSSGIGRSTALALARAGYDVGITYRSGAERAAAVVAEIKRIGRLQTAEQIAQAAVFLCSEEADSVTGTTLLVDGGLSLFKY
jgi:NAD(P)-dependent dehydrogenase (short-subunit alcohol dehydrogenase family)